MEAPMEIRRLEVEKRNQKTAAGVAAFLFLGVLVACFFITALPFLIRLRGSNLLQLVLLT